MEGVNVLGPSTGVSKSIEISTLFVPAIVISLLIPETLTTELTYCLLGALFVRLAGAVKSASVSGPEFVTIDHVGICRVPTLIVVCTVALNVALDLL